MIVRSRSFFVRILNINAGYQAKGSDALQNMRPIVILFYYFRLCSATADDRTFSPHDRANFFLHRATIIIHRKGQTILFFSTWSDCAPFHRCNLMSKWTGEHIPLGIKRWSTSNWWFFVCLTSVRLHCHKKGGKNLFQ